MKRWDDRKWVKTSYSESLSGRKGLDTAPEIILRKTLHRLRSGYRVHWPVAGKLSADIAFPGRKVAIFVDGCFWHGCPKHGRMSFSGPNALRWESKIKCTKERDKRATRLAEAAGWGVVRLWECEIKADPVDGIRKILTALNLTTLVAKSLR